MSFILKVMGDVSHSIFSRGFDPDLVSGQLQPPDRNPPILVNFNYIDFCIEKLKVYIFGRIFFFRFGSGYCSSKAFLTFQIESSKSPITTDDLFIYIH